MEEEKCKNCGKKLKKGECVFMGYCESCYNELNNINKNSAEYIANHSKENNSKQKDNLKKDEKVICEANIVTGIQVFYGILIVVLLLISTTSIVMLLVTLPIVIFSIIALVKISQVELYFTNKRVIGRTGVFSITTLDTPLNKIDNVLVKKSILGYSTIMISSTSGKYNFQYIDNAEQLRNLLMEQMEKYEQEKMREQAEAMAKTMINNK